MVSEETTEIDLRNGRINGLLMIPPEFSRRVYQQNQPRIALVEDNRVVREIIGSVAPFIGLALILTALLIVFPRITLVLPSFIAK